MKKIFAFLCALAALAACRRVDLQESITLQNAQEEIKVNLTINRADAFGEEPGTRATFKDAWSEGDVVFIFFRGVAAPKYLEVQYTEGQWVPTPKNGLTLSDLLAAFDQGYMEMTGVFLPYANDAVVFADNGRFYFEDLQYSGLFYFHDWCWWSYYDDELHGTLTLTVPSIPETNRYVHFDVTGYTDGHKYTFTQEYVRPLEFLFVSDWVHPMFSPYYDPGSQIPGYIDKSRSIISFSGVLDGSAVGASKNYTFNILDETTGTRYTRTVPSKTITKHLAIGLGNLKDPTVWTAIGNPFINLEQTSLEMSGSMNRVPGFLTYSIENPIAGEKLTANTPSWIHVTEITDSQVSFYADANSNSTGAIRTGTITLNYKNAQPQTFTITQHEWMERYTTIEIAEHTKEVSHEGGSFLIDYTITHPYPDCTIRFEYDRPNVTSHPDGWIEGRYDADDGSLSYTVLPNTTNKERRCTLFVKYSGTPNRDTLFVRQFKMPAGPPEIVAEFNPDSPETINGAGENAVSLIAYVRNPIGGVQMELKPDVSWITNIRQSSEMVYHFTASRNTTGKVRYGHINLSYQDQHVSVPFKQLVDQVEIILNPGDMTFDYRKRSVSFDVTLPDAYNYDNLQVELEQDYGFAWNLKRNDRTVTFDLRENNSGEERTTGIIVRYGESQSVFHVTQTYDAPVFTVPETALFFNYTRQTMALNVQIENPRESVSLYVLEEGDTPWFWSSVSDNNVPTINIAENNTGNSRNTFAVIGYSGMPEKVRLRITQTTSHTEMQANPSWQYISEIAQDLTYTVKISDPLQYKDLIATPADPWVRIISTDEETIQGPDVNYKLYTVVARFSKNRTRKERTTSITFKYDNLNFVVGVEQGRNRDIPEGFVDLGLPSGTLWAECNLGAATETGHGTFYAWGEVAWKSKYTWGNYRFGSADNPTKYNDNDNLIVLQDADDAAHMKNAAWSMPTTEDFDELRWHCLQPVWVTMPVPGFRITSMDGETSIFFPAAGFKTDEWLDKDETGYYWTRDLNPDNRAHANYFLVNDLGGGVGGSDERCVGMSVRPVIKP